MHPDLPQERAPAHPGAPGVGDGLLARLIGACFDRPGEVLLACALLSALGLWALRETPLDALPELADPQVIVMTEWPEAPPTVIDDEVTWPISAALRATPGVIAVRGQSAPGASFVTVLFDEPPALGGDDPAARRAAVAERLAGLDLPAGLRPVVAPASGSTGWALMLAVVDRRPDPDPAGVWDLHEELILPSLAAAPGVAEVAPFGGAPHELHVTLDPLKLRQHQIGAAEVARALQGARWVGGGGALELGGHAHMVRAEAPLRSADDVAALPVRVPGEISGAPDGEMHRGAGAPLRLGELAAIGPGPGPRSGVAELDGDGEVLGAVVVLQPGVDPRRALTGLHARLDALDAALPAGVELVRVYDRSRLIDGALQTQARAMGLEAMVLGLVVGLALRHLRSALVILLPLPVAALAAFLPLRGLSVPADLLSLGGLTVAFGALVDGGVVMVENVHRRLSQLDPGAPPAARRAAARAALQEVGPSLFGTLLILTVAFAPVFLLDGPEGRMFRPLALTKTAAMGLGAGLSLSLVPAGVALLLGDLLGRRPLPGPDAVPLQAAYAGLVRRTVARPSRVIGAGAALLLLALPLGLALGREHLPRMDEGDLLYMPTAPPGMTEADAALALGVIGRQLKQIPEVAHVLGKAGRAATATDPAPLSMIEATVALRPRGEWRPGLGPRELRAELDRAIDVPGMPDLFWMPIQTRSEMVSTGVRAPLAARLTGPDPAALGAAADALAKALRGVPGVAAAFTDRDEEGLYYDITLDRAAAARVGVGAMGLEEAVGLAIGGMAVAELRDGRRRTPVRLRLGADARQDPAALARVPLTAHGGALIALGDVARLGPAVGPHLLRSEGGEPVVHVFVDPGEAPLARVAEACAAAAAALPLPGARLEWTGQIAHLRRMEGRLAFVVPLTLALVALLLRRTTGAWAATGLVLLAVPASLTGALALCLALGHHLSGATWVGLLALAGLDAETGVVMLLYLRMAEARRRAAGALRTRADLAEAIVEGAAGRLRPKLMTVGTSALGLLPLLLSEGPGADLMARVAAPLVGGLATSFVVELAVYPAIYMVWRGRGLGDGRVDGPGRDDGP